MRGQLYTLESIIAILMMFFVIIFLFQNPPSSPEFEKINYKLKAYNGLKALEKTGEFRRHVSNNNATAINESLNPFIPSFLSRAVVIFNETDKITGQLILSVIEMLPTEARNSTASVTEKLNTSDNQYAHEECSGTGFCDANIIINFTTSSTYENVTIKSYYSFDQDGGGVLLCWNGSDWTSVGGLPLIEVNNTFALSSCSNSDGKYRFRARCTDAMIGQSVGCDIYVDYIFLNKTGFIEEEIILVEEEIVSVSYFLAGDIDDYKPRDVRVYMWGFD